MVYYRKILKSGYYTAAKGKTGKGQSVFIWVATYEDNKIDRYDFLVEKLEKEIEKLKIPVDIPAKDETYKIGDTIIMGYDQELEVDEPEIIYPNFETDVEHFESS